MFFQPKFYRSKSTRQMHNGEAVIEGAAMIRMPRDAELEVQRVRWRADVADDVALDERQTARIRLPFDPKPKAHQATLGTDGSNLPQRLVRIDQDCPSIIHRRPLAVYHTPPPRSAHQSHSTTPSLTSLSTSSSSSCTSPASYHSDWLVTPIKSNLHRSTAQVPPISDSKAPSRPLPALPLSRPASPLLLGIATAPSTPNCSRTRSPSRHNTRYATPPPPDIDLYASMPLPPLPAALVDPASSERLTVKKSSNKRDSQATVRAINLRARNREIRDTLRPRPAAASYSTVSIVDPTEEGDNPAKEWLDFGGFDDFQLDAFPLPPSRSHTPNPASNISRAASRLVERNADTYQSRNTASTGIARAGSARKAPPPPLPTFQFDVFSAPSVTGRRRR